MGSEESRPLWVDWIERGDVEQLRCTQINLMDKWRDTQSMKTYTPLGWAIQTRWLTCVKLLLEKGGQGGQGGGGGGQGGGGQGGGGQASFLESVCYSFSAPFFEYTPLGLAVDLDEKEMVLLLLRAGASTVSPSKVNGRELIPGQLAKEYDKQSWFDAQREFKGKGGEGASLI